MRFVEPSNDVAHLTHRTDPTRRPTPDPLDPEGGSLSFGSMGHWVRGQIDLPGV
ncbi:hypothetical protein [Phormidesmis priestleyi]|uniref:hypothetical protein n=1 Tax=Phormidesmis priestleyi TaxID=268141 RepID=UPI0012E7FB78|nr:hypothetical protein [Phormidesmis priestleyi]